MSYVDLGNLWTAWHRCHGTQKVRSPCRVVPCRLVAWTNRAARAAGFLGTTHSFKFNGLGPLGGTCVRPCRGSLSKGHSPPCPFLVSISTGLTATNRALTRSRPEPGFPPTVAADAPSYGAMGVVLILTSSTKKLASVPLACTYSSFTV